MDRIEFCQLIRSFRKEKSNKTISDIVYGLQIMQSHISRLENGKHNSNMQFVLNYINFIGGVIVLKNKIQIQNYDDLLDFWIQERKKCGFTQRTLPEKIGVSGAMIAKIEAQTSKISLDVFLKFVTCLNCNLSISLQSRQASKNSDQNNIVETA